jgi:hypothetical protein
MVEGQMCKVELLPRVHWKSLGRWHIGSYRILSHQSLDAGIQYDLFQPYKKFRNQPCCHIDLEKSAAGFSKESGELV